MKPTFFHNSSSLSPWPRACCHEGLVGPHARGGVDIIAFGFTTSGLKDGYR